MTTTRTVPFMSMCGLAVLMVLTISMSSLVHAVPHDSANLVSGGIYKIKNLGSGKLLEVNNWSTSN